jgi:GT2 family glycosyltransferase
VRRLGMPSRGTMSHVSHKARDRDVTNRHQILKDVSIVIPTIGRPMLSDCLESIILSEAWPGELLVVDQSASAEIAQHLNGLRHRGLNAIHLPMHETGIAAAMNHGLDHVRTPLVAVTHDDCLVDVGWLRTLRDRVRNDGLIVVTGRVLPEAGTEVPSVITSTVPATYTQPLSDRDVLFPANMLFSARVWRSVGPMDEDPLLAKAAEDNEWAYRVLRAGVPIVYEPEAVVVHVQWRDEDALRDVMWTYARAQGAFYGKYLRRADLHIARRAALDLVRALWWLARGSGLRDRALVLRGLAGTIGLAQGLISGIFRARPTVGPTVGAPSPDHGHDPHMA